MNSPTRHCPHHINDDLGFVVPPPVLSIASTAQRSWSSPHRRMHPVHRATIGSGTFTNFDLGFWKSKPHCDSKISIPKSINIWRLILFGMRILFWMIPSCPNAVRILKNIVWIYLGTDLVGDTDHQISHSRFGVVVSTLPNLLSAYKFTLKIIICERSERFMILLDTFLTSFVTIWWDFGSKFLSWKWNFNSLLEGLGARSGSSWGSRTVLVSFQSFPGSNIFLIWMCGWVDFKNKI